MKLEDILEQGEQELDAAYQPRSGFIGNAALWILHLCKVLFLLFSAAHGISAALNYAGNSDWQKMLQVAGVITIELTLLSIYIGFITNSIRGSKQRLVAGAAYFITFGLAVMGVIVDSQMNAGGELSASLAAYLTWGLPIAPAIVALASGFIHFLAPDVERQKKEMDTNDLQADADFKALINQKRMALTARRLQHHLEFEAQKDLLKEMFIGYQDEGVRRAIRARAAQRLPALLEDLGIYLDEPRPMLDVTPQARPQIEPLELDGDMSDDLVDAAADRLRADELHEIVGGNGVQKDSPLSATGNRPE